jgi:hypothetical protein
LLKGRNLKAEPENMRHAVKVKGFALEKNRVPHVGIWVVPRL